MEFFVPLNQIQDDEGNLVSNGTVWVFAQNTTTPATLFDGSAGASVENPLPLAATARVAPWTSTGRLKVRIEDAANVQIYTQGEVRSVASVSPQHGSDKWFEDTGSANGYAGSLDPALTEYSSGLIVYMLVTNTNTGDSKLNLNDLGSVQIRIGQKPLAANDLRAGVTYALIYDGAYFQLVMNKRFVEGARSTSVHSLAVSRYQYDAGGNLPTEIFGKIAYIGAGVPSRNSDKSFITQGDIYNFVVPPGVHYADAMVTGSASAFVGAESAFTSNISIEIRRNNIPVSKITYEYYEPSTGLISGPGFALSSGVINVVAGDKISLVAPHPISNVMAEGAFSLGPLYSSIRSIG